MRTVYIVGAGASSEVSLPTGEKLKEHIASALNFEFRYQGMTDKLVSGDQVLLNAISPAFTNSAYAPRDIDRYLAKAR